MPYIKTGRPPGRPRTKEYETLTARVPQELADQARAYASRHRQALSTVLRDGLVLVLEEDRYRPFVTDTQPAPEIVSDAISIEPAPEIVSDMNGTPEIVSDIIHMQRLREIVSDTNNDEEFMSNINYDTTKYALGDLCKHAHDYQGTRQSLRRLADHECLECQRARAQAARQRKRQAMH